MDVRVSRPVKTAGLRLSGLDDSITNVEIAEAMAKMGYCHPDEIRVGEIRMAPSGTGTVWTRCPVHAANKIATVGCITVGW